MKDRKKEKALDIPAKDKEARAIASTRRALDEGEARYRDFWLTLDSREQERLPAP